MISNRERELRLTRFATHLAIAAVTRQLDGGVMRMFTAPVPSVADGPAAGARMLAELRFGTPAFKGPVGDAAEAWPLEPGVAKADGVAAWFDVLDANGRKVFDGLVGKASLDATHAPRAKTPEQPPCVLPATLLQEGVIVSVTKFVYRLPLSA